MQFPLSWLADFGLKDLNSQTVSALLTRHGLEVDEIIPVCGEFTGVKVGYILEAKPHPDADRLQVCRVDVGEKEPLQIVCGAANARVGIKVCVATIGALLPNDFKIKKAKLRGQLSEGMICSTSELGLSVQSVGIMELPEDAPIGQDIHDYLQLQDASLIIDLTANRGDCLSIRGLARELSLAANVPFKEPGIPPLPKGLSTIVTPSVTVLAPKACPCYHLVKIEGVFGQQVSPLFWQERLRRADMTARNYLVDVTNWVMLHLGQPMHAFDADKVQGAITVRYAFAGEVLTLLDGQEIRLTEADLVIADVSGPIALAGIMGGLKTAVTEQTTSILLEAACFTPQKLAGRARQHGLLTDSSYRFERGVDWQLPSKALALAVAHYRQLFPELKHGEVIEVTHADALPKPIAIPFSFKQMQKILGVQIDAAKVVEILQGLAFQVTQVNEQQLEVMAPSFRFDIEGEHDLIEEVARVYGYDAIEAVTPVQMQVPPRASFQKVSSHRVKHILIDRGYLEAKTYSFIPEADDVKWRGKAEAIVLSNPLSQELAVMRHSLLPGLLRAVKYNMARQQSRVRLFELARCFRRQEAGIVEVEVLAGVTTGQAYPLNWQIHLDGDFYRLKNDVLSVLQLQRVTDITFVPETALPYAHPGQCAAICFLGEVIGHIYRLHPALDKDYGLKQAVYGFEIHWPNRQRVLLDRGVSLSKFPAIKRDLALIMPKTVSAGDCLQTIKNAAGALLQDVAVFDLYAGKGVEEGKKSLAFNLHLQASSHTLKEEEVEKILEKVLTAVKETHQAVLRS